MAQLHSLLIANHRPYAAIYADATERLAATGFVRALGGGTVAFTADDLYKKVLQLDNATEWVLTAITPTWVQVSGAGSLANDSITNALLANMAQATIKGRASGAGTGDPTDLTGTQATAILNAVVGDSGAGGTKGLVPAPGAGDAASGKYLDAAGAFSVPPGTGLTTENVQDIVGAMVVAGTNVTVTYNDGAGTLTIDSTGGGSIAPLVIEDANTVAQRNGDTGQTHNIYSSFTDASNYSRMRLAYNSGATTFEIISEALGSGALSTLRLGVGGTNRITIGSGTVSPTHNAYDLGGASNRWSIVYATNVLAATSLQVNGCKLQQTGGNGVWTLTDTSDEPGTWSGLASSPAEFTANQNNYAMPHFAHQQRWSSNASRDVTGIAKSQIADQKHLIINVGANDIVLKHESASSTAANRFLCSTGADITLTANQGAEINYDAITQRWRVFKKT